MEITATRDVPLLRTKLEAREVTKPAEGAVMAAFAGILADPVQARLGLHQRRLERLIAAMAAEVEDGQLSSTFTSNMQDTVMTF